MPTPTHLDGPVRSWSCVNMQHELPWTRLSLNIGCAIAQLVFRTVNARESYILALVDWVFREPRTINQLCHVECPEINVLLGCAFTFFVWLGECFGFCPIF